MKVFKNIIVLIFTFSYVLGLGQDILSLNYIKKCANVKHYVIDEKQKIVSAIINNNFSAQGFYWDSESEVGAQYSFIKTNPKRDIFSFPEKPTEDFKYIKDEVSYLLSVLQIDSKTKTVILNSIDQKKYKFNANHDGISLMISSDTFDEFTLSVKHIGFKTDAFSFWFRKLK
jgi:hypothetical protein